jgi:hypothetical protein
VKRSRLTMLGGLAAISLVAATLALTPGGPPPVLGQGVGDASWTPSTSSTTTSASQFLTAGDAVTYRTDTVWDAKQTKGLSAYLDDGLRYTHEVNDRGNRLSATGFWATNLPDPAYDRDDDDGDRRWEEAEVITGGAAPEAGRAYTSLVQFSRWHGKRQKRACEWAWDRRLGHAEVLSQLSRSLLGEWQAERYTLAYQALEYPRVGKRPALLGEVPAARCNDAKAGPGQHGFVVTFATPLEWDAFFELPDTGTAKWTAFEAIGSNPEDDLTWTCGGPVARELASGPCKSLGVSVDGVVAAVGYLDDAAVDQLRRSPSVARVDGLQDSLTGLLFDVGGFGVERPGLTVNDHYWELFLAD